MGNFAVPHAPWASVGAGESKKLVYQMNSISSPERHNAHVAGTSLSVEGSLSLLLEKAQQGDATPINVLSFIGRALGRSH